MNKVNISTVIGIFNIHRKAQVNALNNAGNAEEQAALMRVARRSLRRHLNNVGVADVFDWTNHGTDQVGEPSDV